MTHRSRFLSLLMTLAAACGSSSDPVVPTADGQPCPGNPTVTYGGQTYDTVVVGKQCWMKQNLNIGTMIPGSTRQNPNAIPFQKYCYDDDEGNCHVWGGLYQWDEAMLGSTTEGARGICPGGWHIPSWDEWNTLSTYVGGNEVAGRALKASGTFLWAMGNTGVNSVGFSLIPAGSHFGTALFMGLTETAVVWTSKIVTTATSPHNAAVRYVMWDANLLEDDDNERDSAFSVRCIRNP